MLQTVDDIQLRAALVRHIRYEGNDREKSHEIYTEDAILEFPQSGERFVGRDTFRTWREQYPASTEFRIRRLTGQGAFWCAELLVSYNGAPPMFGVGLYEFRGDKVAREIVYGMEPWDGPRMARPVQHAVRPARVHRSVRVPRRRAASGSRPSGRRPYPSRATHEASASVRL